MFACFLIQINFVLFIFDSVIKMTSYCLNFNLDLQSMITLIANYFSVKILLDFLYVLAHLLAYISFLRSGIYFLDVFHSTIIIHYYLLLFLHNTLHTFHCLRKSYLFNIFHRICRIFYFFCHFIIFS